MLGKGRGQPGEGEKPKKRSAEEILREACDRNIPVCVVRPAQAGRVPMARGRLLRLEDGLIEVDRVTVPGLDVEFHKDDELEAYFSIGKVLYQFRTTLKELLVPTRLNERMVIPGMSLGQPASLEEGDRRNIFRVSVSARADRPSVQAWRILEPRALSPDDELKDDESEDESGMPSMAFNLHGVSLERVASKFEKKPNFEGWVVDATEQGLGIRLEAIKPGRFEPFEPLLIRVTMPAEAACVGPDGEDMHDLDFVAEVRSKRPVGDDGSRLGIVLIEESNAPLMRQKRRVLRDYLAQVQREHLRKNRGRVA